MNRIVKTLKKSFPKLTCLLCVCAVGIGIGCKKQPESTGSAGDLGPTAEHANLQAHGEHGHRPFANPEELAARWNDPKRDEWQYPQEIVAALALEPGATVADIGAGTGYMAAHLSNAVGEHGTVIAVDASPEMIEYLTARSGDLGPARVVPRKVGNDSPDLKQESVDGVLTLDTWHHVGKREAYAKQVYTGLKHGGRFVVVDYDFDAASGPPKEMRLTPAQVTKELEAAGFRVETVSEPMPLHFMVVGHKD